MKYVLTNDEPIKAWEQLRLTGYMPTPNDRPTIGWGHTSTAKLGQTITRQRAQELFDSDVEWAVEALNKHVKVPLNVNQADALISFIFNLGEANFKSSTLLRLLNSGDYQGAADQLPRWNKQKGKVLRGLVRRRAHERELFLTKPTSRPSVAAPVPSGSAPSWLTRLIDALRGKTNG